MMHYQHDIICVTLVLFIVLITVNRSLQNILNLQPKAAHLPETKFSFNEYSEYPDSDDKDKGPQAPQWDQILSATHNVHLKNNNQFTTDTPAYLPNATNATWDSNWASNLKLGQISAVSIDQSGNIVILHRGDRTWGYNTFNFENKFNPDNGPIKQHTIIVLDKAGKKILQWGRDMFYLPHGLTIDFFGNYWITDVAMHQVFKFNVEDIKMHWKDLESDEYNSHVSHTTNRDASKLFDNSIMKPSLIFGEAFEPGNDDKRFCKPTAVAVLKNGDFFVSDGYCNSRIIKFNKEGDRILQWGRHWVTRDSIYLQPPPVYTFSVPHALAIAHDLNYIFVADRENGRILCFSATNGTFHREYKHPIIGTKIYSVAYAQEKIYLINGPDLEITNSARVQGFVIDINSGNIISQFAPGKGMKRPHDIAVTEDGSEIYVVDLDSHKIYKFLDAKNTTSKTEVTEHSPTAIFVLCFVIAAVILIVLRIGIAAVIARCQKRGCLLTMRKRMRWEAERRENFKLSSLLENRRGKGFKFLEKRPNTRNFRKLNTEPETSEDEHPENSLTKII